MIRFSLHCDEDHRFDGWFASTADYDRQRKRGLVTCPACGSMEVSKSLMAPAVATKKDAGSETARQFMPTADQKVAMTKLRDLRKAIVAASDDVGKSFPEEARKIHYGESEGRPIIGEATPQEAGALVEEGIGIAPLPTLPDDAN